MTNLPPLTSKIDKGAEGGHEFERLMNQLLLCYADRHGFEYEPAGSAGGDRGIDGLARRGGVPGFEGPVAFQFKWLWHGIHKGSKAEQITDSWKRAAGDHKIRHWILVTPHELTPAATDWLPLYPRRASTEPGPSVQTRRRWPPRSLPPWSRVQDQIGTRSRRLFITARLVRAG